ncbi:uncharacterized protein LOC122401857 [Colletes gigas]|uniref:uncharacterized protein LOC122401857 n=1 Tax=Colletes gigas TaxID=935657 RepID=UPI001C9ABFEC|nr:uncharacterized protein LOC122401857 [Colletes gigas]XP_043260206.1 uncharacterized protein LOC122401857 [Colletes gigas]
MEVKNLKIDQHIFEKVLRRQVADDTVKILEISKQCLSEKGLNFLSDLFVATIKYTVTSKNEKSKSKRSTDVIIKMEPMSEFSRYLVRKQDLFISELIVLRDVVPKIKKLVGRSIGPQLWYCSANPKVLIMENLITRKFLIKDRQKGLSLEHCVRVIELLAKFHAGSVAVREKDPKLIESFKDGGIVSTKCPKAFFRLMEVSLLRIANEIQTWSDEKCARAAPKLINLAKTIGTQCVKVYEYDSNDFCVLNHGDCWINNIMFRENEKAQPEDVLLVDFQMAVYTSPAIDLLYFFNICPEFDIKYDKDDYFLEVYLKKLNETMEYIGCKEKPLTMQRLKEALHKRRVYAVFSGIVLYLRMMANTDDTEDFTEVLQKLSGETKMNVFKNPDAVKLAHKMIPVMEERGYLD